MTQNDPESLPTPESIASYVKKNTPKGKMGSMTMHMGSGGESLREADYAGHHITVKAVYTIEVDGDPVTGHLVLTNGGQVQYHGLPNMSFDSTIDLVKSLIDHFPGDFPPVVAGTPTPAAKPAMAGMSGMKKTASTKKTAPVKAASPKKAKR